MQLTIYTFKISAIVILLIITLISSLLPVYISSAAEQETAAKSNNKAAKYKEIISLKLPFLTSGVFLGAGLLHLLPDSIETYNGILNDDINDKYPLMYLLAALGCSIVWFIDLIQIGGSEKMLAVAASAGPERRSSICKLQIPAMATHEHYHTSLSSVTEEIDREIMPLNLSKCCYNSCCSTSTRDISTTICNEIKKPSPSHVLLSKVLRSGTSKMYRKRESIRQFKVDDLLSEDNTKENEICMPHSYVDDAVSRHIVFSGKNPIMPFLVAALFSVHSLLAGLALGVSPELDNTAIAATFAILSHKVIEAIAVGANFAKENVSTTKSIIVIMFYSIMTPFGIILGMMLTSLLEGRSSILMQSVAMSIGAGSFIYLSFHEMTDEHASRGATSTEKMTYFSIGLISMALLAYYV